MTRVAVIGAGSWGTTFAKVLADAGTDVTIFARRAELAKEISESSRNSDYLPGINLPSSLHATPSLAEAVAGAEAIYLAVPSQTLRENLAEIAPVADAGAVYVSLMKGVESGTGHRMSQVIADVTGVGEDRIAVVSGPNLALEIAKEQPTAAVASSTDAETAAEIAKQATTPYFRMFVNYDVVGTEFGGVLKNLIASLWESRTEWVMAKTRKPQSSPAVSPKLAPSRLPSVPNHRPWRDLPGWEI